MKNSTNNFEFICLVMMVACLVLMLVSMHYSLQTKGHEQILWNFVLFSSEALVCIFYGLQKPGWSSVIGATVGVMLAFVSGVLYVFGVEGLRKIVLFGFR